MATRARVSDPVPRPAAFLEAGDHRLRGAHPLGELGLAEPGLGTQVVDHHCTSAAERSVRLGAGQVEAACGRWRVGKTIENRNAIHDICQE
jgi:hypothetical protein